MLALFTFRWYASYLFLYAITCYNIISMCFYYMGKDYIIINYLNYHLNYHYNQLPPSLLNYYHLQRPYKIWWSSLSCRTSTSNDGPVPKFTWAGHGGEVRNSAGDGSVACVVQARWSAWAENGPGWRSRLDVKKNMRGCSYSTCFCFHQFSRIVLWIPMVLFPFISFPELSHAPIYTRLFLCKDMVSCHHRNLEQIEQNRNNNWTHPNVRVHCRPRCCIVGPNLGWLWRKSVPPSWWWIK